ncbi:MAG: DUF2309 domain-containing protein [Rickettsiales bacterium]|nr:DUF2309 domain-containing protein [Rickettsiales bacterium]
MNTQPNEKAIHKAWEKIAPTWPLQNIIACNPLQGFEHLEFTQALKLADKYFQQKEFPLHVEKINEISIKWLQKYFDMGQATLAMPNKEEGLYQSWKKLVIFDKTLHQNNPQHTNLLRNLASNSKDAIQQSIKTLHISEKDEEVFFTLMLTTLNGWSSYVKYLGDWSTQKDDMIKYDYLALRLIITQIIWPDAVLGLMNWFKKLHNKRDFDKLTQTIKKNETTYQHRLLQAINDNKNITKAKTKYDAQLVFCIDVRSEPFRKSLESVGNYQTFGFAGFFGIPTAITNTITGESYAACPVLLSPKHNVIEKPSCEHHHYHHGKHIKQSAKKTYQSLKYNFSSPLPLAEAIGIWSGIWMFIKTFSPKLAKKIRHHTNKILKQNIDSKPDISSISFDDQCSYALGNLKAMGMVDNFSDIVIFCGHGSHSENNAFASSLDCGACAGRHGDSNAKILAQILNNPKVRKHLASHNIKVPDSTEFVAAKHNTTTDEVEIYDCDNDQITSIKNDLTKAQSLTNELRAKEMGCKNNKKNLKKFFFNRANSWSEVQPEWGLAKNAAFIVGPRDMTKNINLEGRSFLHSYDYEIDHDCTILSLILNAPMVVGQWINTQYLFSTLDNTAFGSGSKISQNIVGKISIMQGNGSDLMHGLPSQSVNINDQTPYHQTLRLSTFVYAPLAKVEKVINESPKLQELFKNNWVHLFCVDPTTDMNYQLNNELKWE